MGILLILEPLPLCWEHKWNTPVSDCLTNRIEQDHRGIKQRYYPMLGFGAFESAQRYCQAFDEIRNYFRPRRRMREFVSLSQRRDLFVNRVQQLQSIFQTA